MSGVFPSSPVPRDVAISTNQNTIVTTTASGRRQARQIDGQRFRLRLRFPVMTRSEFAPILAFIMKQRSQLESFTYTPPTLDGMANSTSGVFKAGDLFRFTGQEKVYMCVGDVSSNGSGQGTLTFEPPLRANVSDNAILIYANVDFTVGLTGDIQEFNVSTENYFQYEVDLIEVL